MEVVTNSEIELAGRVATRVASKWRGVEIDDVRSHLYLWLVEHRVNVRRWRSEDGGEGKLYVSLRREAARYCAKEQEVRINRPLNDAPTYPVAVLDRALPYIFEEWPSAESHVNPTTGEAIGSPSTGSMALAVLADVSAGYWGLPAEMRNVLAYRYRDGMTFEEIGDLAGVTRDGAKKRVERALRRLSESLGSDD